MARLLAACAAVALLAAVPAHASPRRAPNVDTATEANYLSLADAGLAAARSVWWNPSLGWWDARADPDWDPARPLARLWDAFPLFEATDAVAIADPTPAHLAAVRRFANGAERYLDANLSPVPGYTWYPDTTVANEHAYFDDNGWWEIGFLDAYRATGSPRYLHDAEVAFRFIDDAGWDAAAGGVWWETLHLHKTAEPLAAEIYVGFALYDITGDASYLDVAQTFLAWADAYSWNASAGLYARSDTDPTVMDYVEGMMIGARLEQCRITGDQTHCQEAEQLAAASLRAFPRLASWSPAPDAIYLRFLLDLYRVDGNRQWLDLVVANAQRALAESRGRGGLYLRRWTGARFAGELLQVHAATVSLFAWIAATLSPAGGAS